MPSLGDMIFRVGANIDGFEKSMGDVTSRLRAIDRDVNKTFGGFTKIGDRLAGLGTQLTAGLTLPLAAVGGAATKMAADFDLGLRKVGSLVGGFSQKEMRDLEQRTLAVSRALGIDAVKATDALYEAISAGVPKENAVDFLAVASKAAIAGVTDTKVAVDGLTSILNAYGLETGKAKEVSDAMFQAVNLGKFQFSDLASSISIAVPLASQLGIGFKDVLAAAATLTSQGFSVSEAMTSIRSSMVAILTPNKAMNELLSQTGYESGQALLQAKGLHGSLEVLRQTTGSNTEALTNALGRVEALGAALGLTGDKAAKARSDLDSVRNSSDGLGAATLAYNEINRSASRQFELMMANIKATAIELGVALLPAVNQLLIASKPFVDFLASAVAWFGALPQPVQNVIIGFTAAVAAIGPLLLVGGTLISTIGSMAAAFSSLGQLIGGGALISGLASLPAMFTNIAFAVQNNMVSALSAGETVLLRMGQAAAIAAAAFAGWKLGEWAYSQIPGVRALGDGISDLALKVPLLGTFIERITGLAEAEKGAADAADFLRRATVKLEEELKRKGITVERGTLSEEEYRKALIKASAAANAQSQAHANSRAEIEKAKKAIQDADKKTQIYTKAQQELGKGVKEQTAEHQRSRASLKQFEDGIPAEMVKEYEREIQAATRAIAKHRIETQLAVLNGRDWNSQLGANIDRAQELSRTIAAASANHFPAWVAGLGHMGQAARGLTSELQAAANQGQIQFAKISDAQRKTVQDMISTAGIDITNGSAVAKIIQAQVDLAGTAKTQIGKAQQDTVSDIGKFTREGLDEATKHWGGFGREVSTIITNFTQDIAKSLFDGDLSWGGKAKAMLVSLGQAVLSSFIQPATAAIAKFVSETIADLLSGRGLGGVLDNLREIGRSIASIFGGGAPAVPGVPTGPPPIGIPGIPRTPAPTPPTIPGAGSAAGSAASTGALATAEAVTGIVTGIVSAVSGVIGNFQMAGMNKSLDLIEKEVRYSQIHLSYLLEQANLYWPKLKDLHDYFWTGQYPILLELTSSIAGGLTDRIMQVHDMIAVDTNNILREIRDVLTSPAQMPVTALSSGAGGPQISISGNTFTSRTDIDYLLDQLSVRVRETGQIF